MNNKCAILQTTDVQNILKNLYLPTKYNILLKQMIKLEIVVDKLT